MTHNVYELLLSLCFLLILYMPLLTPTIGEKVDLDNKIQGPEWWKGVK